MDSLNFISQLNNFSKLLTTNIKYKLTIDIKLFFKDISINDINIAIDNKQCIALVDKKGISNQCSRTAKCDGLCGLHTNRKNTFNTIYNNTGNDNDNDINRVKIEFCSDHGSTMDPDDEASHDDDSEDALDVANHYNFNSVEDYYKATYRNNIYLIHCHSGEVYLEKDHIHIGNILVIDIPLVI